MSVQKHKSLDSYVSEVQNAKPKTILDEDTYTEHIEKIIERDFYPDLPKLQAQTEFLEAKESNNLVKLRQLHIKYGPKQMDTDTHSLYNTPASFETPEHYQRPATSTKAKDSEWDDRNSDVYNGTEDKTKKVCSNATLDKFLARNTSEDNASFGEILQESEKRHRAKHKWLYDMEIEHKQKHEQQLELPNIEEQGALESRSSVDNWQYNARNALMYVPDGVEKSSKEIAAEGKKPREIIHTNTRFAAKPFAETVNKSKLQEALALQNLIHHGKIGPDGKEIVLNPTPRVHGYIFMGTPSPAPGVGESPLMTWGEIEGTPFRLDGADGTANNTPGPKFKIPAIPTRDQIGIELAEQASKAHRAKKREALKRVTANFSTPSPNFGRSPSDILKSLSPAARQLATTKLGIRTHSDKALRASYTPSPHRTCGYKTPTNTPGRKTPKSQRSIKSPSPKVTPKRAIESSLTDNLLNLLKRPRADDFF